MDRAERQIPVDDLELGMFVSRLDRPWLETPFLFQGFTITDPREIAELQRHCKIVYIHETMAGKPEPGKPAQSGQPTSTVSRQPKSLIGRFAAWLLRRQKREPALGQAYKDTAPISVEWTAAKQIHEDVSRRYTDVVDEIRREGRFDVQVMDSIVSPMVESVLRNRDALAWLSRIRQTDDYTYGHSISCSIYAIAFGRHLGLPKEDLNVLGLGALLLDVGKTRIPIELLGKTGKLSAKEMELMRRHVEFGVEILKSQHATLDPRIIEMVQCHHERHDGSGYPNGLSGLDIPVFARIAGVVDHFDAIVSMRPYADPVSAYDAVRSLNKGSGTKYQAEVVEQFVQAVGMFPNGTLVELSTGEVGVVLEQNRVRRLRPKVLVLLDARKKPMKKSKKIDLRKLPSDRSKSGAVWLVRGLETGAFGIDAAEYFL